MSLSPNIEKSCTGDLGIDRLVFRGTLRAISYADGLNAYLCASRFGWVTSPSMCRRSASA